MKKRLCINVFKKEKTPVFLTGAFIGINFKLFFF